MEPVPVPVPVERRGRSGPVRTWLGIGLPILALVAVVGAGLLGERAIDQPVAQARQVSAGEQRATASPAGTPAAPRVVAPVPQARPSPVPVPAEILGLAVQNVEAARRAALERPDPGRLVAVSGWLTVAPSDPRCDSTWYLSCRRIGRLAEARDAAADQAPLVVRTQPGVPLIGLQRQSPQVGTWSVANQAILVGRFGDDEERACPLPDHDCGPVLTIERLAWLRTTERQRPLIVGPGALAARSTAEHAERHARAALPDTGASLVLGIFDRRTLEVIDPEAARATAAAGDAVRVWYLRAIVAAGGSDDGHARLGWSVIDDRTGRVLATGAAKDAALGSGGG
jgi:hypothetical protein